MDGPDTPVEMTSVIQAGSQAPTNLPFHSPLTVLTQQVQLNAPCESHGVTAHPPSLTTPCCRPVHSLHQLHSAEYCLSSDTVVQHLKKLLAFYEVVAVTTEM
jgi:hypothetical protein